jgi:hypothetical protein
MLGLAGCAAMRQEPPPEVLAQPLPTTTDEAMAAGRASETRDSAAAASVAAAHARRRRPTQRSIAEIRNEIEAVPAPLDFVQRLDQAHDRVYTGMQGLVQATDRRFASRGEPLKPVPAAPFRLGLIAEAIHRSDGLEFNPDVNLDISLSLPNIEERLRIFITSSELNEAPRNAGEKAALRAGVRYPLRRYLDFELGVRVDVPPVAFAAVKWTRQIALGDWDFYPFAKLFAETKQSVGYAAAATFDRWTGRRLLRSSTYAQWRADLNRTQWTQSLVYAHARELLVPDRYGSYLKANDIGRGWGVRLLASGENANGVTYYEAGVFIAQSTANRWLFWSIEPLVRWDQAYSWKADPGIRVGINALFWDLARPAR